MKVAINKCFGGFNLSAKAVKRLAELSGRECYFFVHGRNSNGDLAMGKYEPVSVEGADGAMMFFAFDIPNPNEAFKSDDDWHSLSLEQRQERSAAYSAHAIDNRPEPRHDPKLIQVIEELGADASGKCAEIAVIEIPDGVEYEISEYDGNEHIAEAHRTWY
jgi:hypothetical protein